MTIRTHLISIFLLCLGTTLCAETKWVDVTANFLKNPSFDTGDKSDWTITGQASSQGAISFSCMEMWNGYMRIEHQQAAPNGHYRIKVQAFYRTREHNEGYRRYSNGTEVISAYLFVNEKQVTLQSEYSWHFNEYPGRSFTPDNIIYFPNSMETAQKAFSQGAYQNELEFDVSNGTLTFGLYNDEGKARGDNWMIFDNFVIEQLIEIIEPQKGSICLNELMAANVDVMMSPAWNFDSWIELFNPTDTRVTLGGCYLSDDASTPKKWQLPENLGDLPAHGRRVIWMGSNGINRMQAPFKLDCEGGMLMLSNQKGETIFAENYPSAIGRASLARTTDGGSTWAWTATPTPGSDNSTTTYANGQLERPVINNEGGFFDSNFRLYPTRPAGTTLRYTTDGTTPTLSNGITQGTQGILISGNQTLRFRLFQNGKLPSEVVTRTFIKRDHEHTLPAIMVSTDPRFLYDDSIGVYVKGKNGRTGNGQSSPVNWNMDWDRPVNFHYVLPGTGEVAVNQNVDFSISGGWTRSNTPKSFKLKADRVYENRNAFDYPFFAAKPHNKNKTIQVRYGGNDTYSRIKDAALHEIIQRSGIDLDVMSYQPAVHYINGEYKGLINIREPNNKDFAYANWGLGKDELEVYEQSPDSGAYMMLGKKDVLERLYELSKESTKMNAYDEILSLLDIDEYVNYMAAELFLSSWDWPDNNVKAYRKTDGGRYRITFFDLDAAFGTEGREYDEEGEVFMNGNPLRWIEGMQWHRYDYIYDTAERRYGEIKFCTFFLNMLKNSKFRRTFIDALSLMGGSVFEPQRAEAILTELGDRVRPTMAWEGASPDGSLNEIKNNLRGRAAKMAGYMKDYEPLQLASSATCKLTLSSNIANAPLYLNDQQIPYGEFEGIVFTPATIRAEVPAGYRFKGWAQSTDPGWYYSYNLSYSLQDTQESITLIACYEKDEVTTPVVINEISASNSIYMNDYQKRNDWIELYNTTEDPIDVKGMYLSDNPGNPTKYVISKGSTAASTEIAPHGHLIVWCDKLEPKSQLHASFKLANEDGSVSIMSPDQSWKSTIAYSSHLGDQTVGRYPDGTGNVYLMNVPTIGKTNLHTSYLSVIDQSEPTHITTKSDRPESISLRYAAKHLIVRGDATESIQLTIYTPAGQQVSVANMRMSNGKAEADCRHLPAGCYVARVVSQNGHTATCKFMVSN
jgi:hypothetical protein